MRKFTTIMALLTVSFNLSFGQSSADSISMHKAFGGYQFYQADQKLNMSQLVNAMKSNEQAYQEIKSAQSNYTFASILGFAGGFMIGWPIGTAIGGGDPNWALAGIGAGILVVSIPISNQANKQAKSAVEEFNRGLRNSSFWDKNELRFIVSDTGLGLRFNF